LKDFAFTIIVGLVLGTYSSIYVALPLTHWLDRRFFSHLAAKKPARSPRRKKASAVV
jgi:preprotein translocase subunit SecF